MLLENELEGNEFMTVERLRHVQERLRERARHWKDYALTLLKWVLFALLAGISVGDTVTVEAPRGSINYTVRKIER